MLACRCSTAIGERWLTVQQHEHDDDEDDDEEEEWTGEETRSPDRQ